MAEIDDNAHLASGTGTHIFRLKGLQTKVFLNQNPNYAPYDTPPVSASYFMDISINSLLLDDLIFISAASNYIDNSKWPDISFSLGRINNSAKTDIDTYFVDHITKKIGPAWLAKNITGGYNNSDIFHNEDELVQQYVDMDKSSSNLNYLQISPTELSKKLALNKISIHDITTNTPVTLYSPDASGADFVTPGWVAGYDPSYALTTSNNEYLLYDTLDPSGVFIKYGFYTQIGHTYRITVKSIIGTGPLDSTVYDSSVNVYIIDSANNKPLYLHYDDEYENNHSLDSSNVLQIISNTSVNPDFGNYDTSYNLYSNILSTVDADLQYDNGNNIITSDSDIIKVNHNDGSTDDLNYQINSTTTWNYAEQDKTWTVVLTSVTHPTITNPNIHTYDTSNVSLLFCWGNLNLVPESNGIRLYVPDNSDNLWVNFASTWSNTDENYRTNTGIIINNTPSFIIISGVFRKQLNIWQVQDNTIKSFTITMPIAGDSDHFYIGGHGGSDVSAAERLGSVWNGTIGKFLFYNDLNYSTSQNFHNHFLNQLAIKDYTIDASTNIVFYDNTIKSQLIKVLKRGGTSEANPVSGMNLANNYNSKYNIGREIMLSMFASGNEKTINRINDILTYQPPPIVYDVTLGDGYKGDNSGNKVFYLNGVETPILHLTRGLNYEFNIDGVEMSSNKLIFTKTEKTDTVDICLNPIDQNNVITSGLTYEIGYISNSVKYLNPVSFEEFNEQYVGSKIDIDHYTYVNDKNVAMFYTNSTTSVYLEANSSYDIYIIGGGGGGGGLGDLENGGGSGGGGGGMLKLHTITPTTDKIIQIQAGSGGGPEQPGTESFVIIDGNKFSAFGGDAGSTTEAYSSSSVTSNGGGTSADAPGQVDISSNGGTGGAFGGNGGGDGPNGGPGGGGGGAGQGGGGNGGNGNILYFTGGGGGGAADAKIDNTNSGGTGGSGYYSGGAGGGADGTSAIMPEDGGGLPGTFGIKGYESAANRAASTYALRPSFGGGGGAFGGGGGGSGDNREEINTKPGSGGSGVIIICSAGNIYSYPSGITTARKIKWSVPFNEVNVPSNLFYESDISDNLGNTVVINKNPIYGAMRFIDGDVIQFHLDYSQKAIVDASGVAVDSSGNKLGSNPIEEQDYIVRLHVHELFHSPTLKAMSYYPVGTRKVALLIYQDLVAGTLFINKIKILINGSEIALDHTRIGFGGTNHDQTFNGYGEGIAWIVKYTHPESLHDNYYFKATSSTENRAWIAVEFDAPLADCLIEPVIHYTKSGLRNVHISIINSFNELPSYRLSPSGDNVNNFDKIDHNSRRISDEINITDPSGTANEVYTKTIRLDPISFNIPSLGILYPGDYYDFSKENKLSASQNDTIRNWKNWVTLLDSSGIYLNNEASGNILGLQFATDSDEFGIGISTDICNNIWSDKSTTVSDLLLYDNFNSNHIFYQAIDHTTNTTPIDLSANGISFNPDDSSSYTIIMKNVSVAGPPSDGYFGDDGYLFNFSGILAARGTADVGSAWWGVDHGGLTIAKSNVAAHGDGNRSDHLGEGFILEGPNPDDFQFNDNEPYTLVISFGTRSSGERTINAFQIKEDFSIKKKTQTVSFNFSSGYTSYYGKSDTAWTAPNAYWSTRSNRYGDIYIYNGFINDISEILDFTSSIPKWPWEINRSPTTNNYLINTNKFIWAFDASLNGNDYTFKIADTSGVIQDIDDTKLHNQKYNWIIDIKSDGKLCLKTSTDSALNVISTYSNIQLDSNRRYYLWIGSKDASFNFTNLKYLPETRVYDDKVTLGPVVKTYSQGSTASYNTYNVVDQTEVTYNLSTADVIYLVTQVSNKIYINGIRYNEATPLVLIGPGETTPGNTYRFNLINETNLNTRLAFSLLPGTGEGLYDENTKSIYNYVNFTTDCTTTYFECPSVDLARNDFTIEYYLKFNRTITTFIGIPEWREESDNSGRTLCLAFNQGTDNTVSGVLHIQGPPGDVLKFPDSSILINSWHHVALTRESDTFTIYIDGKEIRSETYVVDVKTAEPKIGYHQFRNADPKNDLSIAGFHIINGTAKYTAPFNPPEYITPHENTAILTAHGNLNNVTVKDPNNFTFVTQEPSLITYNGTPGVYDTTQGSRDRVPYVDINITKGFASTFYYYDASGVNTDISGTIVVKTPNEITVTVIEKIVEDVSRNIFKLDPSNSLLAGEVYRFIQSHYTNANHPLRISSTQDGVEYTTGVSYVGVPGQPGSYTELSVPIDYKAEDLYYKCLNHNGMGEAFT